MTTIMVRRAVAVTAIAILFSACGSDSPSSTSAGASSAGSSAGAATGAAPVSLPGKTTEHGTGDATSGSLEVEMDDFYFGPTFIKATPGQKVTLHLKNDGKAAHTFTSDALKVDEQLMAGESKDVQVDVPSTGAVEFHCRFHQSSGMQGAIFTKAGDTVGSSAATPSTADPGANYN